MHFEAPPGSMSVPDQHAWAKRLIQAEYISGISQEGVPLVTAATMQLLQRYVMGELSLPEFLALQTQRLRGW
ncbi:hypothetical protein DNI29_20640 [Hymenobacter sediminis]|uniref:hypothetical protein n=1 Tax=Hymenobacter sediminis TaxID=2218621 RepID=UPI000F4EBDA8|nr:hypothetical protein [Hymenobacter sediminis]RPD44544.1 hypothetical protein DNI29_20640 [Hymenobacter sediminis]